MKYITPEDHYTTRPTVHPSQRQHHVTPVSAPLHVVTVITNPNRYYVRYKLYEAFETMVADAGAILTTVELALRDRHFEITSHSNPRHIQLRSPDIIWAKESLMNVGVRHLPADWEYVAFIDADIIFARPDWAVETIHQLQTYKWVQMWTHSTDLGPNWQPIAQCASLLHSYQSNKHILKPIDRRTGKAIPDLITDNVDTSYSGKTGMLHTGYAHAMRRSAFNDLGCLGDIGVLGSGDRHMLYALLGEVEKSWNCGVTTSYKDYWLRWQGRAEKYIQRNVGVVPGLLLHYWHGSKQHRRYQDRWKILVEKKFDYLTDIMYDGQGVISWTGNNVPLEQEVRNYFAVRNEDSIDL